MRLSSRLDVSALSQEYKRLRRGQVVGVLDAGDAGALYSDIAAQDTWSLSFFAEGKNYDVDAAGWAALDEATKRKTVELAHAAANAGFGYLNRRISIYDRRHGGGPLTPALRGLFDFLNGTAFLDFVRALTGETDIAYADAQLTAFDPGHFLTVHDDDVEGKNRRCAYVLNMTPHWAEDWGGYLCFFDESGNMSGGFRPAFNTLNVFTIPQRHSVSVVSPFARAPRFGVSGWLRAGADPARG